MRRIKRRKRNIINYGITALSVVVILVMIIYVSKYYIDKNKDKNPGTSSEISSDENKNNGNNGNNGNNDSEGQVSSSSINGNGTDISQSPSISGAGPSPTGTFHGPTITPAPTLSAGEISGLSTKKLGWSYSFGGSDRKIIDMCDKFGGIWKGNEEKKKIYITMDIGYEYNNNAWKILDIAEEKKFKINFFIVGNLAKIENPYHKLFKRIVRDGHLVGSHSWDHVTMYDKIYLQSGAEGIAEDLKKATDAFYDLTGSHMEKFFRFPAGEYSEAALASVHRAGYKSVFWSFAYKDWLIDNQPDPKESLDKIMSGGIKNGAVLLLHTVSNTNVEILPELVDGIREQGYEIALLDEFEP